MAIPSRVGVLVEIIGAIDESLRVVLANLEDKSRRGGYAHILSELVPGQPSFVASIQFGVVPVEKQPRYAGFAREKALRLASLPGDRSSWQTRDEAHEMYGGAIRVPGVIFSFSGLPEHGDEALVLLAALKLGLLPVSAALEITGVSGNTLFMEITDSLLTRDRWHGGRWVMPPEL